MSERQPNNADEALVAIAEFLKSYLAGNGNAQELDKVVDAEPKFSAQGSLLEQAEASSTVSVQASGELVNKVAPWENTSGVGAKSISIELSPELRAKMLWLKDNVPRVSFTGLIKTGTEKWVDELIHKHYMPGVDD